MSQFNRQSLAEPAWHDIRALQALDVPGEVTGWLLDAGSLTSKLVAACGKPGFKVQLARHDWSRPLYSEQRLLGVRSGQRALTREVFLKCGEQSWVFARTLIPATSLRGAARRLARLGNRPLGAVLFAEPSTRRERMQLARLTPGQVLFEHASAGMQPGMPSSSSLGGAVLWGRRTLFYYANQPILVNEIFLPDIPND